MPASSRRLRQAAGPVTESLQGRKPREMGRQGGSASMGISPRLIAQPMRSASFICRCNATVTSAFGRFCCKSRRGDWIEEIGLGHRDGIRIWVRLLLAARSSWSCSCDALVPTPAHATSTLPDAHATHTAADGGARAASLASRRRFWAMAASVNSSCAPRGPRNRRRPSLRMRFK